MSVGFTGATPFANENLRPEGAGGGVPEGEGVLFWVMAREDGDGLLWFEARFNSSRSGSGVPFLDELCDSLTIDKKQRSSPIRRFYIVDKLDLMRMKTELNYDLFTYCPP